jgi:ketosteroid isomerase-like protein
MQTGLQQLGQEWAAAEVRGDVSALATMLADDFVGVGPLGFTLTKEQWLDRHRSGDLVYEEITWEDVEVRVHDCVAVAIGLQTQRAKYRGRPVDGRFRATQIYVGTGDGWQIEGVQLSALPTAPEAARPSPD